MDRCGEKRGCVFLKAEEIGEKLFIGENTVNTHKNRIKERLETNENWEIIRYELAYDLI